MQRDRKSHLRSGISPGTWNIGEMSMAEGEKKIRFREDICQAHSENGKVSGKGRAQGVQRDVTGDET